MAQIGNVPASLAERALRSTDDTTMEFRILGPLEVREAGRLLRLGGRRQRALLGVLLLHANEPLSNDRLVHELWGTEPPETAAKMVHKKVSRLRRVLEPDRRPAAGAPRVLVTAPLGYELRIDPEQLDANRFEALVEQARRALAEGDAAVAAAKLREG